MEKSKIIARALELGIPQLRINEGFAIADDADDAAVEKYLQTVKEHYTVRPPHIDRNDTMSQMAHMNQHHINSMGQSIQNMTDAQLKESADAVAADMCKTR